VIEAGSSKAVSSSHHQKQKMLHCGSLLKSVYGLTGCCLLMKAKAQSSRKFSGKIFPNLSPAQSLLLGNSARPERLSVTRVRTNMFLAATRCTQNKTKYLNWAFKYLVLFTVQRVTSKTYLHKLLLLITFLALCYRLATGTALWKVLEI